MSRSVSRGPTQFLALLLGLVLVAAGCTRQRDVNEGERSAPQPSLPPLEYGSRYPLPPEYAEWERSYQERLEFLIERAIPHGMAEPPDDVRFVRFLTPDEFSEVYAECVRAQGFPVTVTWDGGVEYGEYPPEQTVALLEAEFRCDVQYPVHPKYTEPYDEQRIRVVYDYYVTELVPCLTGEGYPAAADTIPTWETFLAVYEEEETWDPYAVVVQRQEELAQANDGVLPAWWKDEWRRINEACPQGPPLERLFPEDE